MSLDKIEQDIKFKQDQIDKAERLYQLYDNPLFKEFIVEGYFKSEAIRLVHLYGDGTEAVPAHLIEKDMYAIGALKVFLKNIIDEGNLAKRDIKHAQQELVEQLEMDQHPDKEPEVEHDDDYAGSLGA